MSLPNHENHHHSYLRASTGLRMAVRKLLMLTVRSATVSEKTAAAIKTTGEISVL